MIIGFRLSLETEEDIIAIAEQGISLFGRAQAQKYHNEVFAIFDFIALNPRVARERHELTPPVRIYPFKAHLVVYLVDDNDDILVVRIRHGREDWMSDVS